MTKCAHCGQEMPKPHGIILNDEAHIVLYDGKVTDPLTNYEYELVKYLVRYFGQHCTAERLADWVYQLETDPPEKLHAAVRSIVKRVRRKLAPVGLRLTAVHRSGAGWKISRVPDTYLPPSAVQATSSAH